MRAERISIIDAPEVKSAEFSKAEAAQPGTPARPKRKWRRRLLVGVVLAGLLIALHAPVLRSVGGFLVLNDELIPTQALVLVGASGPYQAIRVDEVVSLYQSGMVREIILIEDRSSRIVQAGVVPTVEAIVRKELTKHGIPLEKLTVWAGDYRTSAQAGKPLRQWLQQRPDAHVTMLTDQFDSRRSAHLFGVELRPKLSDRMHWHAVADQRWDVSNWWKTRHGIIAVGSAYILLLHTYAFGEPEESHRRWNPDNFERELRQQRAKS